MEYQKFVDALFELGKSQGFSDMEVYFQEGKNFETTVFNQEVDRFSISEVAGLSFRGLYNEKMGYAFTEILDDASLEMLVREAKANAEAIESEDKVEIAEPKGRIEPMDLYSEDLGKVAKADKIDFLKKLEAEAKSLDERVKSLSYNLYMESEMDVKINNTRGMDLSQKSNIGICYVNVLAVSGEENKTGHVLLIEKDFDKFDYKAVAKKAVEETVSQFGASPVASKSYPVVLKNETAADLLGAFMSVFNAENVQKDLSMMKGKIDENVAGSLVTLVDDPFMVGGHGNKSFDAEGTKTMKTEIIKDGVLKTFLHNNKTARKDGIESTGNASKASYKSSINIAPSNLYIEAGTHSFDELIQMEEGMIITSLQGLHSGLNAISGDFSLAANGYLVKDGKIERPVDQITVAGNLKDLLMDVEAIGNDMAFSLPTGAAYVASPSIKIKSLAIAGE
ncbi:TldD/PmbA family protein [Acidaminobacter sp. JC074]|uniref:TldD/PmbA family protein n=1 Tax=Acidaminobacter sp. JC074 TaxID=2530199 RepID=UPI001F0CF8F5|nr:TldD/PmbA family protein [Acidaminobacter sp. JC074]MCH4890696.1 TldD/PmbA family protein [Acidaminobacter sp. JC074]